MNTKNTEQDKNSAAGSRVEALVSQDDFATGCAKRGLCPACLNADQSAEDLDEEGNCNVCGHQGVELEWKCPFCGGRGAIKGKCWNQIFAVVCQDDRCGAEGPTSTTEDGAWHKWSKRPIELPMAEYIDG